MAATKRPDNPPQLSEAEIEAITERLRQGEHLDDHYRDRLFRQPKEHELTYAGKESRGSILAGTMGVPLQTLRRFGDPTNGSSNKLVFGDNLQVLKTLFEMKERGELLNADGTPGVRLCYIDPPFATRQEFRGKQEEKAYADKIIGTQFVEFLRKRLIFIRELIAEDGSLFVHLDQRKAHYVKAILDEIFGESNFRNEIIVKRPISKNLQRQFERIQALPQGHDSILWYSFRPGTRFRAAEIPLHAQKPNGYWHHFWNNANRPTMRYELLGVTPTEGQWKWEKERAYKAVGNYRRFEEGGDGRGLVDYWRETGEVLEFIRLGKTGKPENWFPPRDTQLADTLWTDLAVYENEKDYPTQKHTQLLEYIIELVTDAGDLVLDAFAGSGTTAVAADNLKRRWIAVDCGKLAIYTTQRRLLSAGAEGFDLCTAGLYDNDLLEKLSFLEFQSFCLDLFGCRPRKDTISDVPMGGTRKGAPVHFFRYDQTDAVMGRDYIESLHERIGSKVSGSVCIVAPVSACDPGLFEDIVQLGNVSYFILRVPYSVIEALHDRGFEHIDQPASVEQVNEPLDAYGFDFIELPEVKAQRDTDAETFRLHIESFMRGGLDPDDFEELPDVGRGDLAMVMVDAKYDGELFRISHFNFADELKAAEWTLSLPLSECGDRLMVVFLDTHGNERREIIDPNARRKPKPKVKPKPKPKAKPKPKSKVKPKPKPKAKPKPKSKVKPKPVKKTRAKASLE